MSEREIEVQQSLWQRLREHGGLVWFHVVGAALLTLPQLLIGGDNTVCTAWSAVNMAGTESLGCASKTYIALLIGLSALWLTIFAVPTISHTDGTLQPARDTTSMNAHQAGLTARFAVFFAISMIGLEAFAHFSQWAGPLVG